MAIKINHALVMVSIDDPAYENKPSDWNADLVITGLTANALLLSDGTDLTQSADLKWGPTAGLGLQMVAGTATTAVSPFSMTQTRNANIAFPGVTWTFTDTSTGVGTNYLDIKAGVAGTTQVLLLSSGGNLVVFGHLDAGSYVYAPTYLHSNAGQIYMRADSGTFIKWGAADDCSISRLSAGVLGIGTGASGNSAGTIQGKHNSSDGTAGLASFSGVITNLTIKDGIVTAAS